MKKNFITYIMVVAGAVALPSCDDYLDLKPISDLTAENAYRTASDAEAALSGVYD